MVRALLLVSALAALAAAQSPVIPAGLAAREGNGQAWIPTKYAPSRTQFVYAAGVMPPGPLTIGSFRLRRDGADPTAYTAHRFEMEVFMANRDADPAASLSRLWAENQGPDLTPAWRRKNVDFPALAPAAPGPAPFTLAFVLDQAFAWRGRAFLLEFVVHAAGSQSWHWYADAEAYPAWTGFPSGGSRSYAGAGCPADFASFGVYPYIGYRWAHHGYCRAGYRRLAALDLIGTGAPAIGSVPLPLDLGPLGAPGCSLRTDAALVAAAFTDDRSPDGLVRFELGVIPNDPLLIGATYTEQQLVIDPGFNALGVRLGRLARCTVGGPFTGSVEALQLLDFGEGYDPGAPYARYFEAKALVVELGR